MAAKRKQRSDAGTERPLTTQEKAIKRGLVHMEKARNSFMLASEQFFLADLYSPKTDNRRTVLKRANKRAR